MLLINLSIVAFACVLYSLSYISPKTDGFLYFISAILFFFAGFSGFYGYSDIEIGQNSIINTTTYSGTDFIVTTTTPIYSGNRIFTWAIPYLEIFIGFYMTIVFWIHISKKEN